MLIRVSADSTGETCAGRDWGVGVWLDGKPQEVEVVHQLNKLVNDRRVVWSYSG